MKQSLLFLLILICACCQQKPEENVENYSREIVIPGRILK